MIIERLKLQAGDHLTPAVGIIPDNPLAGVIVLHGYGSCKEEMLGLAWRLAQQGLAVGCIDLPGHGENTVSLSESIMLDIEAAIKEWERFGKLILVGQSFGGRLALVSSAEFVIAISPPLGQEVGRSLRFPLKNIRSHRVNGAFEEFLNVFRLLSPRLDQNRNALIILGERDFKEVSESCFKARDIGIPVRVVSNALHGDVFLNEDTYTNIAEQIGQWLI